MSLWVGWFKDNGINNTKLVCGRAEEVAKDGMLLEANFSRLRHFIRYSGMAFAAVAMSNWREHRCLEREFAKNVQIAFPRPTPTRCVSMQWMQHELEDCYNHTILAQRQQVRSVASSNSPSSPSSPCSDALPTNIMPSKSPTEISSSEAALGLFCEELDTSCTCYRQLREILYMQRELLSPCYEEVSDSDAAIPPKDVVQR